MSEKITWVGGGHSTETKAWEEATQYGAENNSVMRNMRSVGVEISVGVRKRGSRFYVVLIKR
jgi:hypothetical protein